MNASTSVVVTWGSRGEQTHCPVYLIGEPSSFSVFVHARSGDKEGLTALFTLEQTPLANRCLVALSFLATIRWVDLEFGGCSVQQSSICRGICCAGRWLAGGSAGAYSCDDRRHRFVDFKYLIYKSEPLVGKSSINSCISLRCWCIIPLYVAVHPRYKKRVILRLEYK